jgi:hypothetical protein
MHKIYLKAEMCCINREMADKNVTVAIASQPLKNTESCIIRQNEHEVIDLLSCLADTQGKTGSCTLIFMHALVRQHTACIGFKILITVCALGLLLLIILVL